MIDLHCHLLPGLDDGAVSMDDSVEMARQADADGIDLVCATPHIRHDHDVRIGELRRRVEEVNRALAAAGCRVRATTGGEVAETIVEQLTDDELRAVSLGGGGRWVLLEPRPGPLSDSLDQTVTTLWARGFRSLVAHPERHIGVDLFERLGRLVGEGALVQVTAATLCHEPAADGMRSLARAGVVHVLGSDAHSSRAGREVVLSDGLAVLADVEPTASALEWVARDAPAAIVAGADVVPPFPFTAPTARPA